VLLFAGSARKVTSVGCEMDDEQELTVQRMLIDANEQPFTAWRRWGRGPRTPAIRPTQASPGVRAGDCVRVNACLSRQAVRSRSPAATVWAVVRERFQTENYVSTGSLVGGAMDDGNVRRAGDLHSRLGRPRACAPARS
jgi:hypothetical protein